MSMFFKVFVLTVVYLLIGSNKSFTQKKICFDEGWQFKGWETSSDTSHIHIGKNWNDQFTTESVNIGLDSMTDKEMSSFRAEMKRMSNVQWQNVSLPHIAFPEPLVVEHPREGLAYYQKTFVVPATYKGQIVSLEFEGAMQHAWIWVNGVFVRKHLGGYLPFFIDLTSLLHYGQTNTIEIKLDNRANPLVPPGKSVKKMDFIYYSGLYRDAWLHIDKPLHITNPNAIQRVGGGGIFVTYSNVTENEATVDVKTNIINESHLRQNFSLVQELMDKNGRIIVSTKDSGLSLSAGKDFHYKQCLQVKRPKLWSPDSPHIYTLRTVILTDKGDCSNSTLTKIGIRKIFISKEQGVLINDRPCRINGSNRHMSYPWIGNALSDNANIRDAVLIKQSGMNCIRLAHYPQDPSFYDACDSLGILLVDCVPGWQFFNKDTTFVSRALEDVRQMIRRDRNHPSVFLWEVSLNETYPPAAFRCLQVETAKREWPSSENFYTSGDSYYTKASYDVPYDDWADDIEARSNKTYPDNAFLIREYGDFEFGGTQSTTRQQRGNGTLALRQQAWNLQWEHNRNRQLYPRAIGDLTWAFFDGVAGYLVGIEGWGIADIVRIPKFSYYFFRSQSEEFGPLCYIADYWSCPHKDSTVVVYSNCQEVALLLNGHEIARKRPDDGPDRPYGKDWEHGGTPFTGGDVKGLAYPPFTFRGITYKEGALRAIGYQNGKEVAQDSVFTSGNPYRLSISIDTLGVSISRKGKDLVFVRAYVLDRRGRIVNSANNINIRFKITGTSRIVSPSVITTESGIATVLVETQFQQKAGLMITAEAQGLKDETIQVK